MHSPQGISDLAKTIDRGAQAVHDITLVDAAQSGNSVAFVQLCERHSQRLLQTLRRITKNREDAEDALQDALMRAYRNLDRFESRSAFSTRLTAIAINSGLMTLRSRRSGGVSLDEVADFIDGATPSTAPGHDGTPESHFEQRERELFVNNAVRNLPPVLRSAMELRVSQDLSIQEIARHLAISESAVKSRLARAKGRMRSSLRGMERSFRQPSKPCASPGRNVVKRSRNPGLQTATWGETRQGVLL
jgi:RNA polymerase sigma-70 factor, ECF subfamily